MTADPALRPRIAVLLDENTSGGGTRYEAAKGYFAALDAAGGLPFGVPFLPDLVGPVAAGFDGLLTTGGRFAYPDAWYEPGEISRAPSSERLSVETALVEAFLSRDKPVLGLCAGMQALACLHGGRLTADLSATVPDAFPHDGAGIVHPVALSAGTRLREIVGLESIEVNSFHREAVTWLPPGVVASARAPDGVIEAVEIPARRFALGLQWHPELLGRDHPGDRVFGAFVEAARASRPAA